MASGVVEVTNRDNAFAGVTYVLADDRDDLASLRSRLGAVSGRRVALILPRRAQVLDSPATVRVVARIAAEEGINLAIVSPRARTRALARREGLPAFPSVGAIPNYVRKGRPDPYSPVAAFLGDVWNYVRLELTWIVAVALVGLIVGVIVLTVPHAEVTVQPLTEHLDGQIQIQASVDATSVDPVGAVIPARDVYLVVNEAGSVPVPSGHPLDGYATGYVTLTNRTKDRLTVPPGTDVSTYAGTHFMTQAPASLAAREGATALVPVKANQAGPGGNVKSDTILQVNGPMLWILSVVNDDDLAGGGSTGTPVVTEIERQKLLNQLTAKAQTDAKTELAAQTGAGELAVPETVQITPIVENFDHANGQEASVLHLQAQYRLSGMIVNQNQLQQLAIQIWNPTIRAGYGVRPGSVVVDPAAIVKADAASVTYQVPLHAVLFRIVNPSRIADEVRLRDPATARRDLADLYDFASPPTVNVVPNWTGRAYRVDVNVDLSAPPVPSTEPVQAQTNGAAATTVSGTTDATTSGAASRAR